MTYQSIVDHFAGLMAVRPSVRPSVAAVFEWPHHRHVYVMQQQKREKEPKVSFINLLVNRERISTSAHHFVGTNEVNHFANFPAVYQANRKINVICEKNLLFVFSFVLFGRNLTKMVSRNLAKGSL